MPHQISPKAVISKAFGDLCIFRQKLISELIDHIDVYETEGIGKSRVQRVVIYYKFVGYLDIPDSNESRFVEDIRQGVAVEYVSCEPSENLKELFPEEYGEKYEVPENEETEQA